MLRILKLALMITSILAASYLGTAATGMNDQLIDWAISLKHQSMQMVWQYLAEQHKGLDDLSSLQPAAPTNTGLYIFVSTSMPKALLKAYLTEAAKYGGLVVLKGLPNGSFQALAKQLMALIGISAARPVSLQIDDQAFKRFNVTTVPTIILSEQEPYYPGQIRQLRFDKMAGNVGINYSLAEFSQSGDLQKLARKYLDDVKKIQSPGN